MHLTDIDIEDEVECLRLLLDAKYSKYYAELYADKIEKLIKNKNEGWESAESWKTLCQQRSKEKLALELELMELKGIELVDPSKGD